MPLLIGAGVAATLNLEATDPIHVFEYDETLSLRLLTSWHVIGRPLTFTHVTPTRARAESNLTESNLTESKRTHVRVHVSDVSDGFDAFWQAYPKKKAKDAAQKAWGKRRPNSDLLAVMLRALERQKSLPDWQTDSGRYIPFPATWLNRGQWTDEDTETAPDTPDRYGHLPPCRTMAECRDRALREAARARGEAS